MIRELRWRIVVLQAVVVMIFAIGAVIAFWAANFTHSYVHNQLTAQKVSFPTKGDPALSPQEFPDLQQYAGQQANDGPRAKAYANGFIGRHLQAVAGGKTYSEVSAASQAAPNNAQPARQTHTLVRGSTLRALLLSAWGWWTVGSYALYAGVALTVAAIVVLGALLFELLVAPRREVRRAEAGSAVHVT